MKRRVTALIVLMLLVIGAAGCASLIYTDPGPNPARLVVPVKDHVVQAQVDHIKDWFGGEAFLNSPPHYDTLDGPFWDVQAFITTPSGGLHQLPPAPGKAIWNKEGMSVEGEATFLCPPGRHQLRLVFGSSLLHTFYDDRGKWTHPIYMLNRYDTPQVELSPGQEVRLEGLLKTQ